MTIQESFSLRFSLSLSFIITSTGSIPLVVGLQLASNDPVDDPRRLNNNITSTTSPHRLSASFSLSSLSLLPVYSYCLSPAAHLILLLCFSPLHSSWMTSPPNMMLWCWALVRLATPPLDHVGVMLTVSRRSDRVCAVRVCSPGVFCILRDSLLIDVIYSVLSVKGNKVLHIDRNDHYGA